MHDKLTRLILIRFNSISIDLHINLRNALKFTLRNIVHVIAFY